MLWIKIANIIVCFEIFVLETKKKTRKKIQSDILKLIRNDVTGKPNIKLFAIKIKLSDQSKNSESFCLFLSMFRSYPLIYSLVSLKTSFFFTEKKKTQTSVLKRDKWRHVLRHKIKSNQTNVIISLLRYYYYYFDLPHTKQLHRTVQNNVSLLLPYSSMVYPTQSNQHIFAQFFYF